MAEESIKFSGKDPAKILKWKVRHGSEIQKGSILCLYKTENSELTSKFKATKGGTVLKCLIEEGGVVNAGEDLISLQGCTHATVMKDLCALCGANLRNESGRPGDRIENVSASVAMVHSVPELIVSEAEAKKIGREDESRLLRDRKLVLLVDLDQTLLHTTNDQVPVNLKDVHHFQMWHGPNLMWYHTKFRPNIEAFLANISKMYELHICTFGVRVYAHIIAKLLDPEGQYFSHRILSRDECFNPTSKTANLRALFPCGDSMVAIIDDREDVWNFSPNLIHVKPYGFFSGTADINAPPGLNKGSMDGQAPDLKRRKSRIVKVPKYKDSTATNTNNTLQTDSPADQNCSIDNENSVSQSSTEQTSGPQVDERTDVNKTDDQNQQEKKVAPNQLEINEDGLKSDEKPTGEDNASDKSKDLDTGNSPVATATENLKKEEDHASKPEDTGQSDGQEKTDVVEQLKEESQPEPKEEGQIEQRQDSEKESKDDGQKDDLSVSSSSEEEGEITSKDQSDKDSDCKSEVTSEKTDKPESSIHEAGTDKTETSGNGQKSYATSDSSKEQAQAQSSETSRGDDAVEYEEMVEWDDPDDYLLYLEDILTRIHTAFYECYDQTKNRDSNVELPSLKKIIPYVHKKVLKHTNIVFSGVFPTNMPAEKSRAYIVAKALGAEVQSAFVAPEKDGDSTKFTTHVVAARPGTQKVRQGRKQKKVHVVSAEWLWTCADRWERVDERLYPLKEDPLNAPPRDSPDPSQSRTESRYKKRKSDEDAAFLDSGNGQGQSVPRPAKVAKLEGDNTNEEPQPSTSTSENLKVNPALERRFSESYNPMLMFSRDDIDDMDKEVEDILDASDSESDEDDEEKQAKKQEETLRSKVLKASDDSSSDADSLSGDFPRGWKKKFRKNCSPKNAKPESKDDDEAADEEQMEEEAPDQPNRILRHSSDSESESDKESFDDSIGSADDEMAAAVEKEFLNF